MSYAEQYFGVKETEAAQYANDLAWFGKDSYVYKSSDLMMKIIKSTRGLLNPVSNFYILTWLKDNGLAYSDYLDYGFTISVYNSDYDASFLMMLYNYDSDGNAEFVTPTVYFNAITSGFQAGTNGVNILNPEDYNINQMLNGSKVDWYNELKNKIDTLPNVDLDYTYFKILKGMPGFLHGLNDEVKGMLRPIKETSNGVSIYLRTIGYNDAVAIVSNVRGDAFSSARFTSNLLTADKIIGYKIHKKYAEDMLDNYGASDNQRETITRRGANIKSGFILQAVFTDEVTASQISARPTIRGGIYNYGIHTLFEAQSSNSGAPSLTSYVGHLIKMVM